MSAMAKPSPVYTRLASWPMASSCEFVAAMKGISDDTHGTRWLEALARRLTELLDEPDDIALYELVRRIEGGRASIKKTKEGEPPIAQGEKEWEADRNGNLTLAAPLSRKTLGAESLDGPEVSCTCGCGLGKPMVKKPEAEAEAEKK